jgi:hypothetical protein
LSSSSSTSGTAASSIDSDDNDDDEEEDDESSEVDLEAVEMLGRGAAKVGNLFLPFSCGFFSLCCVLQL